MQNSVEGEPDTRRKAVLASGKVRDFAEECKLEPTDVDVNLTVLAPIEDKEIQSGMLKNMMWKPTWTKEANTKYSKVFDSAPTAKKLELSAGLLAFIEKDCDFKLEHADGSFMDHLKFGGDYVLRHYPSQSPIPCFLHSIMGVASNLFPMPKEKIPKLKTLLTAEEYQHVEAFPTFNRLLLNFSLFEALDTARKEGRLEQIKAVRYHRLIDNEPCVLDGKLLWPHLNFHLIHNMDFLPISDWGTNHVVFFFQMFLRLRSFLAETGHLEAKIEMDLSGLEKSCGSEKGVVSSFREILAGTGEGMAEKRAISKAFVEDRSAKIGHSLNFSFEYNNAECGVPSKL